MSKSALDLTRPLPSNVDAERFILGAIMMEPSNYPATAQRLDSDDFSIQKHRDIFAAMGSLVARDAPVDRVTLADELLRRGDIISVGLGYVTDLDTGMPQTSNISAWVSNVKDKARLRQIIFASQATMNEAYDPAATPREAITSGANRMLGIGMEMGATGQTISQYMDTFPGGPNTMLDPSKWVKGVPTGFAVLDDWTDGFHEEEIFLVGARPGVGKSSIGLDIADNVAQRSGAGLTAFFSLEMSKQVCVNRLICKRARIPFQRFRKNNVTDEERKEIREAARFVKNLPIHIDDNPGRTVPDIEMRLRTLLSKQPVALAIIDYVQLMHAAKGQRYSNENEMFTHVGNGLQSMTKSTGVPLLLLSQLNRASESRSDKRPALSDCRGAGVWEQIANVGAVIFREELYKKDRADLRGLAEFIVQKNRSGPSGTITLAYIDYLMTFEDRSD